MEKMFIRLGILTFFMILVNGINAQKKLHLDINLGVLNSIGKNEMRTYNSTINPLQVDYYSQKKYKHSYINLQFHLKYPMSKKVSFGVQSGLYMHFSERYFNTTEHTSISIPLLATIDLTAKHFKTSLVGVSIAGGKNFFKIDDDEEVTKNGSLMNASIFYRFKRNILKFGVEKQIDNVSFYYTAPNILRKNEKFSYHLHRLAILFSYGFTIN